MWPEVRQLGVVHFTLYDLMRVIAVISSFSLCAALNRIQGIALWKTVAVSIPSIPFAIVSARLLNSFENGATLLNIGPEFFRNAGSSIYGALLGSILLAVLVTPILKVSRRRFLDAGAPAMALGEALSRIGCFCSGCCYGTAWNGPWAISFPAESFAAIDQRTRGLVDISISHSLPVHPVQIYSTILSLLLAYGLTRRFLREHRPGEIFFLLLIFYGVYRLAIAPFRAEALMSMILISLSIVSIGMWGLRGRLSSETPMPSPER
jgi:phosphatidylglycerol---prolipoprotein diacylglyceryl transferase